MSQCKQMVKAGLQCRGSAVKGTEKCAAHSKPGRSRLARIEFTKR